jgi:ketosteroid isomerase-like protein
MFCRKLVFLSAALFLAACSQPTRTDSMDAAKSLAAAETAFAAHSVREDMRAAFLAAFADDGVFVRNGWVVANGYLAGRPAPAIVLDWRPQYVEVAASGEMGLSTGPWKLASKAQPSAPPAYGQFVTIWKREPGKAWKVAVDLGIAHPAPTLWDQPLVSVVVQGEAARSGGGIRGAEERYAADARSGLKAAYAQHGSQSLRFYRDANAPLLGKAAALASSALSDEAVAWTVERVETARSGDFGFARGSYAARSAPGVPLGYYLRVWRVEAGEWRIALDVVNPAPKP